MKGIFSGGGGLCVGGFLFLHGGSLNSLKKLSIAPKRIMIEGVSESSFGCSKKMWREQGAGLLVSVLPSHPK